MAYTIVKSDGTVLTTIADGTINTTSTSLGLPGFNFAGYGQALDNNFVHQLENFASTTPPTNPIRGQLWFNTNNSTMYVCPVDGTGNANSWLALTSTSSGGSTTFGAVTVTGDVQANNFTAAGSITGDTITARLATVTATATVANATVGSANIASLQTTAISTGAASTAGTLTGTWTVNGGSTGNAFIVTGGNVYAAGIKTDNYFYANGAPFNPTGTYNNSSVYDYLVGANAVPQFTGNIAPTKVTTTAIAGGGVISGIWTLGGGARLNATYADLAERFEADAEYAPGTVVQLGGEKEVTVCNTKCSDLVFGVVSDTAAYLMNSGAGEDATHPAIALSGRVDVLVTGPITKGQRLVSAGNGHARAATAEELTNFNTIGRSLVDDPNTGVRKVLAFVTIK